MTLLDVVLASLVLLLGTSAASQLWIHGLRSSRELAQREERFQKLEALLLASEGMARDQAARLGSANDCQAAVDQLLPRLRALSPTGEATLTQPPTPAGTLHLRWEAEGLRRERLYSPSALGLCREARHEA